MSRLFIILSRETAPEKNLQLERSIFDLDHGRDIILRLWRARPCVVMGRFQKEEFEVNLDYARQRNIPVLRRFTGGGTVYHDEGNLNITFCKNKNFILSSNYFAKEAAFLTGTVAKAISRFIKEPVQVDYRNSIFISGRKVSGSSVAISKDNFFWHATLLINSDLEELKRVIKWEGNYPENSGNFIKSIRSQIVNLREFNHDISMELVEQAIISEFEFALSLKGEYLEDRNGLQF